MTYTCDDCGRQTRVPVTCLFTGRTYCSPCWVSVRDVQPCPTLVPSPDGPWSLRCWLPAGHDGDHSRTRWEHSA